MKTSQTYFCNASDLGKIRLSGKSAPEFVRVMTTVELRRIETPGEASLSLVLNAEGEIIDLVMVGRTGQAEYMLITHPNTVDELTEWLEAHAALKDPEGQAVFEDLKVENRTKSLASFALYGPAAQMILDELGHTDVSAHLGDKNLTLITIGQLQVMVIRWPFLREHGQSMPLMPEGEVFEVYLPAQGAEDFKEILFGFEEIDLESFEDYLAKRKEVHTWLSASEDAAYIKPTSAGLKALMRAGKDFVGARALLEEK